jgi:hypothetical protein
VQAGHVFQVIGVPGELCLHLPILDPPWLGLLRELQRDLLPLLLRLLHLTRWAGADEDPPGIVDDDASAAPRWWWVGRRARGGTPIQG